VEIDWNWEEPVGIERNWLELELGRNPYPERGMELD